MTTTTYTETSALTRRLAQELVDCGHDITTVDLLDALASGIDGERRVRCRECDWAMALLARFAALNKKAVR